MKASKSNSKSLQKKIDSEETNGSVTMISEGKEIVLVRCNKETLKKLGIDMSVRDYIKTQLKSMDQNSWKECQLIEEYW